MAEPAGAAFQELLVLPGDDVTPALVAVATQLRLGPGLAQTDDDRVVATRAGVLSYREPNRFFVLSNAARYVAAVGDTVVGVVTDRLAESYRVRLHGTTLAQLPNLAFDGATRRNKPSLGVGALVFARVAACSKHMEPELSCCALPGAGGPKKDWVTGQSVFGPLKGGQLVHVSPALARRLLDPSCALLATLGKAFPFELAVGVNGLLWLNAPDSRHAAAVEAALAKAELLTEEQCAAVAQAEVARAVAAGARTGGSGVRSGDAHT